MYRIGLADDHKELRTAIRLLIVMSDDMDIAFLAENGREAVEKVKQYKPDVLVMDMRMPELDGLSATEEILALSVGTRVILTSSYDYVAINAIAQEAGAFGFIHKNDLVEQLRTAIRIVAKGGTFFN